VSTSRRSRPKDEAYLPSPEEIRRRALAVRNGEMDDLPPPTEDDWRDWEQEREQPEQADRDSERQLAAEDRMQRQADLILDLARSTPQRAASVNAGSPVAPGKEVPHYLAYAARLAVKRLMLRGRSDREIVDHFSLGSNGRLVLPWLREVREHLYTDCQRYFQRGWTMERVFRNYFLGPSDPQRDVKPEECRKILTRLRPRIRRS
jgi:hypothetical protein